MYNSLVKEFYKNSDMHEEIYFSRINNESSVRLPLYIKAWQGKRYQLFYLNTPEITNIIANVYELIHANATIKNNISKNKNSAFMTYYMTEMMIEEIIATNNIEGIKSTRRELLQVKELLDHEKNKPIRLKYVFEKYSNLKTDNIPELNNYEDLRVIYDEFISDEIEKENRLDGKWFRKESVDVVDGNGSGRTIHRGVLGEEYIIDHVTQLIDFMNTDNGIPKLIKIAIFQYYFGYIHPFYDGNGRVSRYITSLYLKDVDYLLSFKISKIIFDNIKTYYTIFNETNKELNKGDLTPFILQILKFFKEGVEEINLELKMYQNRLDSFNKYLERSKIMSKAEELEKQVLYIIYQSTLYSRELSVKDLSINLGKSYRTIKKRIDKLVEKDLVCRVSYSDYKVTEKTMENILDN